MPERHPEGWSRRSLIAGAAAGAAWLAAGGSGSACSRLALVYDATRFKLNAPRDVSAFFDEALYRGPRGLRVGAAGPADAVRFRDARSLADLIRRREVALALVALEDAEALQADPTLSVGRVTA